MAQTTADAAADPDGSPQFNQSPDAQDADDAETVQSGNLTPLISIKIEINNLKHGANGGTNNNNADNKQPPTRVHWEIIKAIADAYSEEDVQIVSQKTDDTIDVHTNWPTDWKDYNHQFHTATIASKRNTKSVVSHALRTNLRLQEIKNHPQIRHILKTHQAYLSFNPWPMGDLKIASIGWLLRVHPQHYSMDVLQNQLQEAMNNVDGQKNAPSIRVYKTNPSIQAGNNKARSYTRAVEIQCHADEYRRTLKLLEKVYKKTDRPAGIGSLVPYKERYNADTHAYRKALWAQNTYLEQSCNIPIVGISFDAIYHADPNQSPIFERIIQSGLFETVEFTNATPTIGRWNLVTNVTQYSPAKQWIHNNLSLLYNTIPEEFKQRTDGWPSIGIYNRDDDSNSTDSDRYSFASTIARSLPDQENELPPTSFYADDQQWLEVPNNQPAPAPSPLTVPGNSERTTPDAKLAFLREEIRMLKLANEDKDRKMDEMLSILRNLSPINSHAKPPPQQHPPESLPHHGHLLGPSPPHKRPKNNTDHTPIASSKQDYSSDETYPHEIHAMDTDNDSKFPPLLSPDSNRTSQSPGGTPSYSTIAARQSPLSTQSPRVIASQLAAQNLNYRFQGARSPRGGRGGRL